MNSGNVTVCPALKFVITKSSIDRANASRPAAATPGAISGSVIFRNVVHSLAPRSIAASSMWRSIPSRRAFTVTTTYDTLNMMCAITIVTKARDRERVQPVRQREALPGEVEAPLVRVEREQDDDEDRHEQVEQREPRPEAQQLVADRVPAPRARPPAARLLRGARVGSGSGGFDHAHTAASVRFLAPSALAYANTAKRITPINMNESAAAVG